VEERGAAYRYPYGQSVPEPAEADVLVDPAHGLPGALARFAIRVQFRHHDIGGVGDDGARDTGDVTTQERDSGLLEPVVCGFGLAEVVVDLVDGRFESCEFTHRVWDLATPEGVEAFVEPGLCHQLPYLGVWLSITEEDQSHADKGTESRYHIPSISLFGNDLPQSFPQRIRKRRQRRLHAHLDSLKRTQGQIGKEFRRRTRA
jgi:hypothetical protein